jgi:hypothetical protein
LEGREEGGVNERWLGVFEASGDIAGQAEVWVLVNGTGDESGNLKVLFRVGAEDVREGVGEGGGGLDGGEMDLANVVTARASVRVEVEGMSVKRRHTCR